MNGEFDATSLSRQAVERRRERAQLKAAIAGGQENILELFDDGLKLVKLFLICLQMCCQLIEGSFHR